ncbi:hypothetical protein ACHAWF_007219, partial [Thalassiosira exigua]
MHPSKGGKIHIIAPARSALPPTPRQGRRRGHLPPPLADQAHDPLHRLHRPAAPPLLHDLPQLLELLPLPPPRPEDLRHPHAPGREGAVGPEAQRHRDPLPQGAHDLLLRDGGAPRASSSFALGGRRPLDVVRLRPVTLPERRQLPRPGRRRAEAGQRLDDGEAHPARARGEGPGDRDDVVEGGDGDRRRRSTGQDPREGRVGQRDGVDGLGQRGGVLRVGGGVVGGFLDDDAGGRGESGVREAQPVLVVGTDVQRHLEDVLAQEHQREDEASLLRVGGRDLGFLLGALLLPVARGGLRGLRRQDPHPPEVLHELAHGLVRLRRLAQLRRPALEPGDLGLDLRFPLDRDELHVAVPFAVAAAVVVIVAVAVDRAFDPPPVQRRSPSSRPDLVRRPLRLVDVVLRVGDASPNPPQPRLQRRAALPQLLEALLLQGHVLLGDLLLLLVVGHRFVGAASLGVVFVFVAVEPSLPLLALHPPHDLLQLVSLLLEPPPLVPHSVGAPVDPIHRRVRPLRDLRLPSLQLLRIRGRARIREGEGVRLRVVILQSVQEVIERLLPDVLVAGGLVAEEEGGVHAGRGLSPAVAVAVAVAVVIAAVGAVGRGELVRPEAAQRLAEAGELGRHGVESCRSSGLG